MSEAMKAVPAESGSLAGAHERIAGLLDELNQTVDLVERLTSLGEHEAALRLVEEQRAALYAAIEDVSHGVGRAPRWREAIRRHAAAGIAAAALLLSSLAVSVGLLQSQGPTLIEQARAQLVEAEQVADPVIRLKIIERVVQITMTLPAGSQEKADLARDVLPALDKVKDDAEDGDGRDRRDVVERADALSREVQDSAPPTGGEGAPAPSTDQGPLNDIDDAADPGALPPSGG